MIDITTVQIEHLLFVTPDALASLPEESAVYFAVGPQNAVLYVGQSVNLRQRWAIGHQRLPMLHVLAFQRLYWLPVAKEDLLRTEAVAIARFHPVCNVHKPSTADLQDELEGIYARFYGNVDGQLYAIQK